MRSLLGRFHRPMSRGLVNNMLTMNNLGDGSTLNLDFTTMGGVLDPRLTFSRASTATFVNSSGYVEYAGANLLLQGSNLGNATSWFGNGLTSRNASTDPNGSNEAVELNEDATNTVHAVIQVTSQNFNGLVYTSTVYMKAGTNRTIGFMRDNNVSSDATVFYTLTGSGTATIANGAYGIVASINAVGGSWYRCVFTIKGASTANVTIGTAKGTAYGDWSFAGTVGNSIHVWGAQLNPGSTAQTYYPTTTAAYHAPRFDYSPTNIGEPRGLLVEGQGINVCIYSQAIAGAGWNTTTGYTVTTNTTDLLSPAGDNTATKLVYTSGYARCIQTVNLAANTTYTMSYWIKSVMTHTFRVYDLTAGADIASSIGSIPVTSSWTRVQKTFTTGASTSSCWFYIAPDGGPTAGLTAYVWGAQVEAGSGASSYIPTGASQVTRNADHCTIPTASFIPGNPYPQTLFVDCIPNTPSGAFLDIARIFDRTGGGAFSYGTEIYYYTASTMTIQRKIAASTNTDRSLASGLAYGTRHKFALSISASSFFGSYDGVTGLDATTAPAALATVATHLGIGCNGDSSPASVMFGTIRQIKFYPTALAQAQINALTAL